MKKKTSHRGRASKSPISTCKNLCLIFIIPEKNIYPFLLKIDYINPYPKETTCFVRNEILFLTGQVNICSLFPCQKAMRTAWPFGYFMSSAKSSAFCKLEMWSSTLSPEEERNVIWPYIQTGNCLLSLCLLSGVPFLFTYCHVCPTI